ncbi:YiiG family protein [Bosea sp. (in: a-proteobacteria)]|uniref:YiiG family protein n=1 Tax=Bosea sp. (in: a-proteobacteria) TaxID=1871050 RepID=UPI00262E1B78|nr:YiiG family protein [Bosea sp. (in: a-proteobacteria)]MCO5092113.1 YiiG family protein [Bosea sp. (in: a-proteobacteria)]
MSIRAFCHGALCAAAIVLAAPGAGWAQGTATMPAGSADKAAAADLQAAIVKSNAYTGLMNRTLRAIQSWERYGSWVDMKKGPTGKERYITYGLYSLYDVAGEIRKAEEAMAREPSLPAIDETVGRYVKAYQELAPLITRAERYYDRKDYRDDNLAEGQRLHALMVPAARTFLDERAKLDALMRVYKRGLDQRELAAIEQREGRSARWQVRNIMINARAVMDLMPSNERPIVDLKAFNAAVADYAGAIREMDAFKDKEPKGVPFIESQASSWLGKLRDFSDKLARSKGDVRRGAANDANWIVNNYNTMVSLSETAARMSR